MLLFKEYIILEDEAITDAKASELLGMEEALTMQARTKLKNAMRKNKAKIARARKIASKKKASKEKIEKRAKKQAIEIVKKKMLKGKDPSELSFSARAALEKRVKKKSGAINKLAKRLVKKVKQDERERMANQ